MVIFDSCALCFRVLAHSLPERAVPFVFNFKNCPLRKMVKSKKKIVKVVAPATLKLSTPHPQRMKKQAKKISVKTECKVPSQIASDGGLHEEKLAEIVSKVQSQMNSNEPLTESGVSACHVILNPCGEHANGSNKHFPDGTLSQAAVLKLRLFETIVPPFLTEASSPNSTNNWSLYGISPPCYKTVCVLIASSDASGLSDQVLEEIFEDFNTNALVAFPDWKRLNATSPYYYTVLQFPAADLKLSASSGTSAEVESFRIVGDGFVVMHNTPDLWNQGSMAVGQFDTDFEVVDTDPIDIPLTLKVTTGPFGGGTPTFQCELVAETGQQLWGPVPSIGFAASPVFGPIFGEGGTWTANTADRATTVIVYDGPQNLRSMTMTYTPTGPNPGMTFQCSGTPALPSFFLAGVVQQNSTYIIEMFGRGPGLIGSGSVSAVSLIKNPPLSQASIVQLDPKYSAELMKKHEGFYAVRRYFEPVLNMTEVSVSGPIRFTTKNMNKGETLKEAAGGISNDVVDKNGASIAFAVRGISWACLPTIKANRFIELLASPDSSLAPFVEDCPPKDEDAIEVFRQMQLSGPHSFIPDANMLGYLASMITTIVESLPVFLRGAKSISKGVTSALEWAETTLYPV